MLNSSFSRSQSDRSFNLTLSTSPFKSQSMSQLSQMFNNPGQSFGRFAYFLSYVDASAYFPPAFQVTKINPTGEPISFNEILCRSIEHLKVMAELIVPKVNDNIGAFVGAPVTANVIEFLKYYFRFYPYLNRGRFKSNFMSAQAQFLNFWRSFLMEIIYTYRWKPTDLGEILWDKSREEYPQDYLINMVTHIIKYYVKHILESLPAQEHRLAARKSSCSPRSVDKEEPIRYQDTFAFLVDWFNLYVDFLYKDTLEFCSQRSSQFYFDLTDPNELVERPIVVGIFWSTRRPDYTSSTIKWLISMIAKVLVHRADQLLPPLLRLFSQVAEILRLGTGNLRPFTSINSSRMLLVSELYQQFSKHSIDKYEVYQRISPYLGQCCPWLKMQWSVELLARHGFLNVYHYFPQALESPKYRLSLRLLVHLYLLGDVSKFKYDVGEAERRRRRLKESKTAVLARSSRRLRERELAVKAQETVSSELNEDYRKYIARRTGYGGTALHVVCRRGEQMSAATIGELMAAVDINQTEHRGYTPLMDAIRFGHYHLVPLIISEAERADLLIDFGARNLDTGETVLHLAMREKNWKTIKAILETGGKHLLTIESYYSVTPSDLIEGDQEMQEKIAKLQYRNYEQNVLPVWRPDDVEANLYTFLVAQLFEAYLATTKLAKFVIVGNDGNLDMIAFKRFFGKKFKAVFDRVPNELDLDIFKDDAAIFLEMIKFVECFLKRQFEQLEVDDELKRRRWDKALEMHKNRFVYICRVADNLKLRCGGGAERKEDNTQEDDETIQQKSNDQGQVNPLQAMLNAFAHDSLFTPNHSLN